MHASASWALPVRFGACVAEFPFVTSTTAVVWVRGTFSTFSKKEVKTVCVEALVAVYLVQPWGYAQEEGGTVCIRAFDFCSPKDPTSVPKILGADRPAPSALSLFGYARRD